MNDLMAQSAQARGLRLSNLWCELFTFAVYVQARHRHMSWRFCRDRQRFPAKAAVNLGEQLRPRERDIFRQPFGSASPASRGSLPAQFWAAAGSNRKRRLRSRSAILTADAFRVCGRTGVSRSTGAVLNCCISTAFCVALSPANKSHAAERRCHSKLLFVSAAARAAARQSKALVRQSFSLSTLQLQCSIEASRRLDTTIVAVLYKALGGDLTRQNERLGHRAVAVALAFVAKVIVAVNDAGTRESRGRLRWRLLRWRRSSLVR
jgi:hypothetical protein